MKLLLLVCLLTSIVVGLDGQTRATPSPQVPPRLEDIEKLQQLNERQEAVNDALAKLNELTVSAKHLVEAKRLACLGAFGSVTFCGCLANALPMGVSFKAYIGIVTTSKAQLDYASLSKSDKDLADGTFAARETCVSQAFGRR